MTEPSFADQGYWVSPFEELIQQEDAAHAQTQPSDTHVPQFGPAIGTPEKAASTFAQQRYSDDCAVRSQQTVLEQLTGQQWDEAALAQEARHNGWYAPGEGGTSQQDIGNMLELHGVPVNRYENATVSDLGNELAQGHEPIIFVSSGDLWQAGTMGGGADHTVVVSGIDTADPNNPQAIINDPGTGEVAARYPLDQVLAAWQESNFYMVSPQEAVPGTGPDRATFDHNTGQVPQSGDIPHDNLATIETQPEMWNDPGTHIPEAQTYALNIPPEMDERYTLPVGDTYSPTVEPPPPTVDPTSSGNHIGAHEALASWYGPELQGSPTASGEPFDPYGYTCAHKTLPFGTQLLVSYEGKTVQVTVNDRGPYIDGRELDLSQGAADALGLTQAGVGYVEISYPGEDSNVTGPGVPAVETYTPTNTYDVYTPTNTYDMYAPMVSYDLNTPVSPGEEILATQDPEEMNQEFGILHDDNPDVW